MAFSTNPYNNFQAANLKEFISLDKGAKQDFHPKTHFHLIPGNSDLFSGEIEKFATQFGYGSLLNVPSNRDVDASDMNAITYKDPINMIETWNKMTDEIIAKNKPIGPAALPHTDRQTVSFLVLYSLMM